MAQRRGEMRPQQPPPRGRALPHLVTGWEPRHADHIARRAIRCRHPAFRQQARPAAVAGGDTTPAPYTPVYRTSRRYSVDHRRALLQKPDRCARRAAPRPPAGEIPRLYPRQCSHQTRCPLLCRAGMICKLLLLPGRSAGPKYAPSSSPRLAVGAGCPGFEGRRRHLLLTLAL